MNYSDSPGMVRVDYFKPSGKWYMTEAHDMSEFYNEGSVYTAVEKTLVRDGRYLRHFDIVVLEPYHFQAFPVMIAAIEMTAAGEAVATYKFSKGDLRRLDIALAQANAPSDEFMEWCAALRNDITEQIRGLV